MEKYLSRGRFANAGDHIEQRRFAGAGSSRNAQKFALSDIKIDVIKRRKRKLTGKICFDNILQLDNDSLIAIGHTRLTCQQAHASNCDSK